MLTIFDQPLDLTIQSELCEIMGRYGSDKSPLSLPPWHNYTRVYHSLFSNMRVASLNVFELGIGTVNENLASSMGHMDDPRPGASILGWKAYFPAARIFAGDYDREILLNEDRIQSFYCDQTQPESIAAMWNSHELCELHFDIMIDDANHQLEPNECFLEHSIHKLASGGIYIIEDVIGSSLPDYQQAIQRWKTKWPSLEIELVQVPFTENTYDNNLVICRRRAS